MAAARSGAYTADLGRSPVRPRYGISDFIPGQVASVPIPPPSWAHHPSVALRAPPSSSWAQSKDLAYPWHRGRTGRIPRQARNDGV